MRTLRPRQITTSLRMPPALKYRPSNGKIGTKKGKSTSTMAAKPRMREWLEHLMDNNKCSRLAWVNKEEKTFEISWNHASRTDFDTKEHADLFIQYAKLTGRTELVNSAESGYNSKLKSNFRSALHSLNDCIRIKDAAGTGTQKGSNAVRVYQFIDPSHPEYLRKKSQKISNQRNSKRGGAGKSKNVRAESITPKEEQVEAAAICQEFTTLCSDERIECTTVTDDNRIILTDEAEAFIIASSCSNSNSNSSISNLAEQESPMLLPIIPDISMSYNVSTAASPSSLSSPSSSTPSSSPSITATTTTTNPITALLPPSSFSFSIADRTSPLQPPLAVSFPSTGSTDINSVNDTNSLVWTQIPEFKIDTSALGDMSFAPTLPKFSELGVNDTFDEPIVHASQRLSSGGSMRVRKENSHNHNKPPQKTYAELQNAENVTSNAICHSQQGYTYHVSTNESSTTETEAVFQFHSYENIQSTASINVQVEEDFHTRVGFDESDATYGLLGSFGHIIEQNEAVTVVINNPDTISQGENYNLPEMLPH